MFLAKRESCKDAVAPDRRAGAPAKFKLEFAMAYIRRIFLLSQLRSDASSHVISYSRGRITRSGRGLVFWFRRETASVAELPMDDREMSVFVKGRSKDFQAVSVQGTLTWHIADPAKVAERIDFSLDLKSGKPLGEPIERIQTKLAGLVNQTALQYLSESPVQALLDAGLAPLRLKLDAALLADASLADLGIAVAAVRVTNLAPSTELERALQTPTFEALQQKADQATFERRALAVEKERAIAENELANKTELARREKLLIAEDVDNARARATGKAEASQIEAAAEALRIRTIESANSEAELARISIYRDLPSGVLPGLAMRDLAAKLQKIDHVNVTPDLLASLIGQFKK